MSDSALLPPRPIDHVVVAVRDLELARTAYARLGFTVTPVARHPFGTANALVQLGRAYIELVAVVDESAIPAPVEGVYSFGAFIRDYLAKREGIAMLALNSRDAEADRADFAARDLPVYAPVHFKRLARNPKGEDLEVAFSVAFTSDARMPDAGFLACQHHNPGRLW
ncbi:MAG TPA: VOC family protein, partial [Bauldia sp.]|nr:VOC family protein [Bauldia sp.]